mmetsp:Transcript_33983/g.63047  ORF Transcript_33983/g.63047 Transcript_33983/m.63047 type:complete len:338 (-) Transcript_33983:176-1189(-)
MGRILGIVALMAASCFGAWSRIGKGADASLQQTSEIVNGANNTTALGVLMGTSSQTRAGRDWDEDAAYASEKVRRERQNEDSRRKKNAYWKLGIAFGVVCCLMATLMVVYAQMDKYEDRHLEGGTESLPVAHCTWLCPCTSDGEPIPPNTHPKLRLTDEDGEHEEYEERKEETVPLVGGAGIGISLFTLLYGGIKIAWGTITILDMLDSELIGCNEAMVMILGICACFTAAEGALVLLWAAFYTTDIRNGMRVSCPTILFSYAVTMVHLILNSVGTGLAYDKPPDSDVSCSINVYAQVFFTSAFVIFFVDLAVIARELGIVSKFETNPYRGLGFWDH